MKFLERKILFVFCLLSFSILSSAHEFWIHSKKFVYAKDELASIDFMVGENFEGKRWSLKKHHITRLEQHTAKGFSKITLPADTSSRPLLSIKLTSEGTHMIVMQSDNALIELDAEKFNAYLKEDGLDEVLNQRTLTNTLDKPAKEYYQRNTKLLLKCGAINDETYKQKVGFPLEIIPLTNPYAANQGDELQFRIFFEGNPHRFSLVKVWHKSEGRTFMQNVYSDKDGVITTRLSGKGAWMVSSVKMTTSTNSSADWQSYWGSLVFGLH